MIYGGLDLLISRTNIRSFASAVACLSKIGKEVFVHSNAEGMTLSALSDTKSCYVTIRFDTDFFMQCNPLMGGTCSGGVDERELKRLTQRRKKRIKEMKEREREERRRLKEKQKEKEEEKERRGAKGKGSTKGKGSAKAKGKGKGKGQGQGQGQGKGKGKGQEQEEVGEEDNDDVDVVADDNDENDAAGGASKKTSSVKGNEKKRNQAAAKEGNTRKRKHGGGGGDDISDSGASNASLSEGSDDNDSDEGEDDEDEDDCFICRVPVKNIHNVLRRQRDALTLRLFCGGVDEESSGYTGEASQSSEVPQAKAVQLVLEFHCPEGIRKVSLSCLT